MNLNPIALRASSVFSVILLACCGGGGGGSSGGSATTTPPVASLAAVFSDSPVVGLTYSASPSGVTGVTNALGQFKYAAGDTVTFSAAGINLGTASNLPTTSTGGNPSVITPVNLVTGATGVTNPTVTAIGQLLAGLNSVAVAVGQGNGGVFTIPSTTGLTGTSATTVSTMLASLQASAATAATLASAVAIGGIVQTAIANASGTIPSAANAQANMSQGLNGAGIVNSLWTAPCTTCGTGGTAGTLTLYFNSDGVVRGFGVIGSNSNGSLIGTWQASSTSSGSANFTVVTAPKAGTFSIDGSYLSGSITGTSGTAQIYDASRVAQGASLALTPIAAATGTNTAYVGGWQLFIDSITTAGQVVGNVSGSSGFFILSPTGNSYFSSGAGSGTFSLVNGVSTSGPTNTQTLRTSCQGTMGSTTTTSTVNLATGVVTTSDATSGQLNWTGHLARAGLAPEVLTSFYDNATTALEAAAEQAIPLSLNVDVSWPANTGTTTSALDIGVVLTGANNIGTSCVGTAAQKLVSYGIRPELNSLGSGAAAGHTLDTFATSYIKNQAQAYQVSVIGPASQFCSVTQNGSGSVVDANSGNASSYPTVKVVCTQ